MRVTAEAKKRTRQKILEAAARLFTTDGYERTTTRDIARAAGIAAGTLFNYFASKDALALTLIADGLTRGAAAFESRRRGDEALEEDLFAHVVCVLGEIDAHRVFVGEVVGASLSPFAGAEPVSDRIRTDHLETVGGILHRHGADEARERPVMHLYWTLFLGVLSFWSADGSPSEEDTLALLDRSMRMFAQSIRPGAAGQEA